MKVSGREGLRNPLKIRVDSLTADCPHQGCRLSAGLVRKGSRNLVFLSGFQSCTADSPTLGCELSAGLTRDGNRNEMFSVSVFEVHRWTVRA